MFLRILSLLGVLAAAAGGAGIWMMIGVMGMPPTRPALTIFFGLLAVTVVGLALPISAYANYRLGSPGWIGHDRWRVLRQATEAGMFVTLCAWLQKERMFNWPIGAITLAVFVLMEVFFVTRHKD